MKTSNKSIREKVIESMCFDNSMHIITTNGISPSEREALNWRPSKEEKEDWRHVKMMEKLELDRCMLYPEDSYPGHDEEDEPRLKHKKIGKKVRIYKKVNGRLVQTTVTRELFGQINRVFWRAIGLDRFDITEGPRFDRIEVAHKNHVMSRLIFDKEKKR